MRKLTLALSLFLVSSLTSTDAWAAEDDCNERENGAAIVCDPNRLSGSNSVVYTSDPTGGGAISSSGVASGATSTVRYVPYNRLSTDANGEPCATTGYVQEGVAPPDERLLIDPNPRESNIPITGHDLSILETYPPCPERPRAPGQPAPVETREMVAARIWERIPLPRPQPFIAPGRAITGKLAYLETRGEITHTYRSDTIFGPLEIIATGYYIVDWGDGADTEHNVEGRPWPDGQITHDYLDVGSYDIVVTEKWNATWRLDGDGDRLRTLQTTGRIDDFPVEQIQAVITG